MSEVLMFFCSFFLFFLYLGGRFPTVAGGFDVFLLFFLYLDGRFPTVAGGFDVFLLFCFLFFVLIRPQFSRSPTVAGASPSLALPQYITRFFPNRFS
jgi:hypothetical protein